MNDVIVSVRMPKGLSEELKQLAKHDHFMDVSEAVRSILRHQFLKRTGFENKELMERLKLVLEGLLEWKTCDNAAFFRDSVSAGFADP